MSDVLSECIRDGTFPDSNELLSQDASPDGVSSLLANIQQLKDQTRLEIQAVSSNVAGDVDEWIVQAKRVQDDIARCKLEARNIIEEHQRGEILRNAVKDGGEKVQLLETEVAFTKALETEIKTISEVTQVLSRTEHALSANNPVSAVNELLSVEAAIQGISAIRTRTLLARLANELREKAEKMLMSLLESRWAITQSHTATTLTLLLDADLKRASENQETFVNTDAVLSSLQNLGSLPLATSLISHIIEAFITSMLSVKHAPYPSDVEENEGKLSIQRDDNGKDTHKVLAIAKVVLEFLHQRLPAQIRDAVAHEVVPRMAKGLVAMWLDIALPHELHELHQLIPLKNEVSAFATTLQQYSWPGANVLNEWTDQISSNWLARRRATSLDSVRKAFSLAKGVLRPVERVERQVVKMEASEEDSKAEDDGWNEEWEDEPETQGTAKKKTDDEDEDVSGWDFETDDDHHESDEQKGAENVDDDGDDEDDAGDAWGWGDDENPKEEHKKLPKPSPQSKARPVNGEVSQGPKEQEMVLRETYHITDIPDYILETIGRDVADSDELQKTQSQYFSTTTPASGLSGIPNLTLAMFRAIAPMYYTLPSAAYSLSNINLYNDVLYIIQRLDSGLGSASLRPATQSLHKFARQVYSSELEIQRTIINDLLDGAQGFERCTTFPNSQSCNDAVSSVVDRLRHLQNDWVNILGESHLLQSLGLLMTMVFGKMIKDIEDLDDIGEAESKQLVTYCQQILSLEDLFVSRLPNLTQGSQAQSNQPEEQNRSQILLYVPNYLRFQYLQQILESSLVDIKYLWTEGELSLEFSVDEVTDLIKALFAESHYRRDAIRAIREAPG